MKKKILALFIVALLAAVPVMADDIELPFESDGVMKKGEWGIGLNLGTNTGVAAKYGYGIFDIYGNVGLSLFDIFQGFFNLRVDAGADFVVYDVDFGGGHHMPITVGAMVPVGILIGGNAFSMSVGALATAGLQYRMIDIPLSFYFRLGLGLQFNIGNTGRSIISFGYDAGIGILYMF